MPERIVESEEKEFFDERIRLPPDHTGTGEAPPGAGPGDPCCLGPVQQYSVRDGALPEKTKQLIAVAVAHVTQCPYCIKGHTKLAKRKGASAEEIMEAIWVAAEMRAGGAYAHSTLALHAIGEGIEASKTG